MKGYQVGMGSLGLSASRLWKGEVGALVLPPTVETPWDLTPVHGINQKLGFVALQPAGQGKALVPFVPHLSTEPYECSVPILVVHRTKLGELLK